MGRVIFIGLLLIGAVRSTSAQELLEQIVSEKDSVELAGERYFRELQKQRKIYERRLLTEPKQTLDSVYLALIKTKRSEALERLTFYEQNDRIDTLYEIDLSYFGLKKIPEFVYRANALKVLILDFNSIKRLPKKLQGLDSLKRLYWRGNNLDDVLWVRMPKLKELTKLDLSKNKLRKVPFAIRKLDGLRELVLEENLFKAIPIRRVSRNTSIKTLSFNRNHIPLQLLEGRYDQLEFIQILKINNVKLERMHPTFYKMAGLKDLQLQENRLKRIPAGIDQLKKLEKLSFYKNQLTKIPEDVFQLVGLTAVDFYYNKIEIIPEEIGQLEKLQALYLSHNRIYTIPESIKYLTNLKELYLHHNRLTALPSAISALDSLEVCRVNENYLMEFPEQFIGLQKLKDLDLADNQIKRIPADILDMPSLYLFTITNNPINFSDSQNENIANVLYELSQRGVIVAPRIEKEIMGD
jgi:Leucine-rich repeat (LRR) protein